MEFAGEVLAEFFGLNQSKYQWVIDQMEREREEKAQAELEEQQRRELRRLAELKAEGASVHAMEAGGDTARA